MKKQQQEDRDSDIMRVDDPDGLEYVSCDLCGAAPEDAEVLPWFHVSTEFGDLQLRRCRRCSLVYQSPRLAESALARVYDRDYFEQGEFGGRDKDRSYFNPEEQEDISRFHRMILSRIETFQGSPSDLLEVGCAGGHFLLLARDRGYHVSGVEISEFAASEARTRYDLSVVTGTLEESHLESDSLDIIYLKDVLEHVRHPSIFLAECHRLLRPGGLLVVLVPNYINAPLMRLYSNLWSNHPRIRRLLWSGKRQYLLDKPFHIYEYTRPTLRALLERAGFDPLRVDNYTLPPLPLRHGGLLVGSIRFIVRWIYYAIVSTGLIEGDRLDFYLRKSQRAPIVTGGVNP